MKKILAFSGSNSSKSINQQLVHIAVAFIESHEVEIISLRDYDAPIYGVDKEETDGFPKAMQQLQAKMDTADAFLVSSPEHNGAVPAVFKNTIDWLSRMGKKVFQGKPVIFLTTSPGVRGGKSAMEYLLNTMPRQGAEVIGSYSLASFYDKVKDGKITNEEDLTAIKSLMQQW
jgi:chromate reductase